MKSFNFLVLFFVFCAKLFASPVAPLDYSPSEHSDLEIKRMYKSLFNEELKGEDCFKRAYIWSYQMVNNFNARPIKVFFHYTDKFNFELDSLGESSSISRVLNGGSKIVWDFHVAPAVANEAGEIIVMDPKVFPGRGPMTLNQWVDGLSSRGEHFLKKRKTMLFDELDDATKKLERNQKRLRRLQENGMETAITAGKVADLEKEIKDIKATMDYIGIISRNKTKKITCDEITNIEDFDKNQNGAWCFYQKTSMYYFATGELRVLNYGTLGNHTPGRKSTQGEINALINSTFRYPVNETNLNTKEYFTNGKTIYNETFYADGANYQATDFTDYYLELALTEVKTASRPELEWFKTHLKLKDPEMERRLEEEAKEEERIREEAIKEEERRIEEERKEEEARIAREAKEERRRQRAERRAQRRQDRNN